MIASPSAIHNAPSTTSARHLRLSTRAPTRSIASRIMIGRLLRYAADTFPPCAAQRSRRRPRGPLAAGVGGTAGGFAAGQRASG